MVIDQGADDASFLADLTGFLNTLQPPTEPQAAIGVATEVADLLVDSDQLLAETEALLASCDGPSGTAGATQVPPRVPTDNADAEPLKALEDERQQLRNKQAAKRRLKYRNKLKGERQTLREQEKTLSDELGELLQARKRAKATQERRVINPVWKGIATRQMEGRLVAEEQQHRLKSAVASRQKVLQEVGEMMRQQLCGLSTPQPCEVSVDANTETPGQLNADDIALFEDYLQDIDTVHAQTDEAFRDSGLERNPRASYKVGPVRKRDGDVEYLESLDVLLVPHGFNQTCSAMWQAMVQVHRRPDRQRYRGVTDPENTIAVKLRIPCLRDSGEPVDVLIHLVTRRYVESGRTVIVWRAMTEGEDEFSGMHSDEYGWCVIRPNDNSNAAMPTVMETFARFIPMSVAAHLEDKGHADLFARFVVTSGEDDGAEISRMMETLLLGDSAVGTGALS